ncbi:hypothetical protein QYE76_034761 [Lolium multiflorum]|uniref:CCHC-type domain-containing protein n=1 Tax=Lolium multiflorum TaxID=4521 RepID=A0AAD8VNL6_LOLMU|nr:hypothetical protein QYE76_034761 [Lolium multiflorum]
MLAMTGHAMKLSDLGIVIPNRLGINRVLQSLPPSYKNFVMNYNMQNMNKELPELFGMLKAAEIEIKKEHQVLMVNKTTSFKKQGKSKGKFKKGGKKAATPPMKPKNGPKPDAECYYCKEKGHWKRNCSKYLADLKSGLVKKKKEGAYFHTKLPDDRRADEVGPRGGQMIGGVAQAWPRHPMVWALVTPLDLPFRLQIAFVAKPPVPRATIWKTFQRRRRRQSHLGDSGDRLRHPAREGNHLPEDSTLHGRLRSDV